MDVDISWTDGTLFYRPMRMAEQEYFFNYKKDVQAMFQNEGVDFQSCFVNSFKAQQCYFGLVSIKDVRAPKWQLLFERAFKTIERCTVFDRTRYTELLEDIRLTSYLINKLEHRHHKERIATLRKEFSSKEFGKPLQHLYGPEEYIDYYEQVKVRSALYECFFSAVVTAHRRWVAGSEPGRTVKHICEVAPRYEPPYRRRHLNNAFPLDYYELVFEQETTAGSSRGPTTIKSWGTNVCPLSTDPTNPLYAPKKVVGKDRHNPPVDWRKDISMDLFMRFVDHILMGETQKIQQDQCQYEAATGTGYWSSKAISGMLGHLSRACSKIRSSQDYSKLAESLPTPIKENPAFWKYSGGILVSEENSKKKHHRVVEPLTKVRWEHEISRWISAAAYLDRSPSGFDYGAMCSLSEWVDFCAFRTKKAKIAGREVRSTLFTEAAFEKTLREHARELPHMKGSAGEFIKDSRVMLKALENTKWVEMSEEVKSEKQSTPATTQKEIGGDEQIKEKKKKISKKSTIKSGEALYSHLADTSAMKERIAQYTRDVKDEDKDEDNREFLVRAKLEKFAMDTGKKLFDDPFSGIANDVNWKDKLKEFVKQNFDVSFKVFLKDAHPDAKKYFPKKVEKIMRRSGSLPSATVTKTPSVTTKALSGTTKASAKSAPKPKVPANKARKPLTEPCPPSLISPDEPLKTCFYCGYKERSPLEFKGCGLCYSERVKDARFYCQEQCQRYDWWMGHSMEHKDEVLELESETERSDEDS